ncbi:MAG: uracil-DNA glycosylase [Gammaproteobacteria bacterium]|nr:uracil-DNA glycosylase [Gammaproteobacteria bacterium]
MSQSFNDIVTKPYRDKTAQEILHAAPDALKGVSANDAKLLQQAFGINDVRDFAANKFFSRAQTILAGSSTSTYDTGPPLSWDAFFSRAPLAHYEQHPTEFRLEFGPVYYRGRLDGTARLIVLGQDPSVNEILAQRVFVGHSGQRLQGFFRKLGLSRSYIMVNTYLYSVYGQFMGNLKKLSSEAPILPYRNECLDRLLDLNPAQAILAVGRGAQDAVARWPRHSELKVVEMTHPSARDEQALLTNWNNALDEMRPIIEADDNSVVDPLPYGDTFTDEDYTAIPRFDLPFGLPQWHGVGSHARRDGPDKIIWQAP